MSTTVDNRVVELQFDNKQFESNVKTTMSTLERLKQSLNFKGASKGLDEIQASARKVDFSGMSSGIDTVSAKFSALQIAGVTALANITNSAVNATKNLAKSLSVDQVTAGWNKYELKTQSVQTLVNATGKSVDEINHYLDQLMWYSDETSYGFTDMTASLSQLTSAGGDIEKLIPMIQGVANATAFAGKGASEFSRAIYNLNQSYSAGHLQYTDWRSLDLAGVTSKQLRQTLINTAVELGRIKEGEVTISNFAETLKDKWADTEVMEKAFSKFSELTQAAYAAVQAGEFETTSDAIAALSENYDELAVRAFTSAQEAKSFTEAIEATKDAVSSGWMRSAEIVFGNYEEAKVLWTELANVLWDIFASGAEVRNALLESALGRTFSELTEKITGALGPALDMADAVTDVTSSIADMGAIVDDVILGKFGNGQKRFDALTESGKNYYRIQNEVNKKLGDGYRYTEEQIAAQDEFLIKQGKMADATKDTASATGKLTKAQKDQIKELAKLSDEQLKAQGYTEEQIAALQELRDTAKNLSVPFDEFIDKLDEINGRWFLIRSFENIGKAIADVFNAISTAFYEVFEPIQADQIFDLIIGFHKLTAALIPSKDTLDKITRTFRGLFSVIDMIATVVRGGFKIAFSILSKLLGSASSSVLDFTAYIGDMLTKLNEWLQNSKFFEFVDKIIEGVEDIIESVGDFIDQFEIDEKLAEGWTKVAEGMGSLWSIVKMKLPKLVWPDLINRVLKAFGTTTGDALIAIADFIVKIFDWLDANTLLIKGTQKVVDIIKAVIDGIIDLYESFMALEPVQKFIEGISNAFTTFFSAIGNVEIGTGAFETLLNTINSVFTKIEEWVKTLGDSEQFGVDLVTGLVNGIISGIGMVLSAVANLADSIITTICGILGIHSPSTVMYDVGQNVVQGLVNGIMSVISTIWAVVTGIGSGISTMITNGTSTLYDAGYNLFSGFWNGLTAAWTGIKSFLSGVGQGIAEVFEKIDWGVVITIAGAVAAIVMFTKLINVFDKFGDAAKNLTNPFKKLGDLFGAMTDGVKENMKAKALKTKADALKSLATALAIIVGAVVALSLCDTDKAWKGVAMIGALAAIFAALAAVLVGLNIALTKHGTFGDNSMKSIINIASFAGVLVSMSVLLLAFAASMKIMSSIDGNAMKSALVAITVFGAILLAFTALAGWKPPNTVGMEKTMLGMAAIFLVMAVVLKILGSLTGNELKQGLVCLYSISAIIIVLMALTNIIGTGKNLYGAAALLLDVALAMGVMAVAMKIVGSMSWNDMGKALVGMAGLTAVIAALMWATKLLNKDRGLKDVGLTLLGVAAAIGILGLVVKLIATTPFEQMRKGVTGVALLGLVMIMLVKATKHVGGNDLKGVATTLFGMSLCIGILAGACVILGLVDPKTVWKGVAVVGALASIMALLTRATKHAGAVDLKGTMIGMAVAIGVLAASIAILSYIEPKKLIAPTVAMTMLLGFFAIVVAASKNVTKSIGSIIALTVAIGLIAGALAMLSKIPAEQLLPTAAALAIAMGGLSIALLALGKVGTVAKSAIGGAFAMAGVVAILAAVLGVLSALDLTLSIGTAVSLSVLLIALSGSVVILSAVGGAATAALPAVGVMAAMIVALGALLIAIGALMKYVPEAEEFLNKGVSVLESLGKAIGSFFGGIIGGFAEGVTSALPNVADNLSNFMIKLKPFISGLKMVDDSSLSAAKSLAEIILTLTAAGVVDAITSWITGGKSLDSFAEQLNSFGEGMKMYATTVEGINIDAINNSVDAAKGIVGVLNALPKDGGVFQAFSGRKDLAYFGNTLIPFGEGMKSYGAAVDGVNVEAINNSVGAATGIVDVLKALPRDGGVFQAFTGTKDLASFGNNLVPFGKGMKSYSKAVAGLDAEAIITSADAAESLVKVAETIPSEGGFWQAIAGEKDLGSFATSLVPFGLGMREFGKAVVGLNVDAVVNAVDASEALVRINEVMPHAGILEKDYAFISQLVSFGKHLRSYASCVEGIDVEAVENSVAAGKALCDLVDRAAGIDTNGASSLATAMKELATVSFDRIISAFGSAPDALKSIGNSFITGLASGMVEYGAAANTAALTVVMGVKNAIADKTYLFELTGKTMVGMFSSGVVKSANIAGEAAKTMANTAASAIASFNTSFYAAGAACANGFANGIAFNTFIATNKARAMANAAAQAAKEELDINSPSKVFMAIGQSVPEGFAKGVDKYGYYVNNSIESMATNALDNTKSVISRIGDALSNTDMDSQPTIRPVVDLSGVESGAAAINGMFGNDFAFGAKMNLNAISSSMHRRNQNGVNDDVVSAIDRLRKDVGNLENRSYSIGDITYSSGDEIGMAIETLTRAVMVGRRA